MAIFGWNSGAAALASLAGEPRKNGSFDSYRFAPVTQDNRGAGQ